MRKSFVICLLVCLVCLAACRNHADSPPPPLNSPEPTTPSKQTQFGDESAGYKKVLEKNDCDQLCTHCAPLYEMGCRVLDFETVDVCQQRCREDCQKGLIPKDDADCMQAARSCEDLDDCGLSRNRNEQVAAERGKPATPDTTTPGATPAAVNQ